MTIKADGSVTLDYGPVGDSDDPNPWKRAQARMPEGWHVEGQIVGNMACATNRDRTVDPVYVIGRWPQVLDRLVEVVAKRALTA